MQPRKSVLVRPGGVFGNAQTSTLANNAMLPLSFDCDFLGWTRDDYYP